MPNPIHIRVENPDEILDTGLYGAGAIIRIQSSATEAGAFADLTGTGSTPTIPVVTLTRSYFGKDPNGLVSTWYRARYENVGATRLSDWLPAFQTGDETEGQLCSPYDVAQRMFNKDWTQVATSDQETILEIISEVSDDIEDYVGRWLAPRPRNASSTTTLLFDGPDWMRRDLLLENGYRHCGIRTLTSLGTATQTQPESGGMYTSATLADVLLRPRPTADGPATKLVFTDTSGGFFYPGYNTVSAVGSFGPAVVAPRIRMVALAAVTKRYQGKETGVPASGEFAIWGVSREDQKILDRIAVIPVG